MTLNDEFLSKVYTVETLTERLREERPLFEEIDLWTMVKMYTLAVPPVWLHDQLPVWSRERIERWIEHEKQRPVSGMLQHRREVLALLRESHGVAEVPEHEKTHKPIVGLATGGEPETELSNESSIRNSVAAE